MLSESHPSHSADHVATEQDDDGQAPSDDPDSHQPDAAGDDFRVDLMLETPDTDPPITGWIERLLARIAALAGVGAGHIGLLIVDDRRMAALHEQYRGQAVTTDVLSFDLRGNPADPLEGDIAICIDQAAREARRRGTDARVEALLYAVHGLLHLLGEDDVDPDRAERMHRREDKLLSAVGVGPVYAAPVNPASKKSPAGA